MLGCFTVEVTVISVQNMASAVSAKRGSEYPKLNVTKAVFYNVGC